ncbi:MAG TPA: hypothetical protein VNT30_20145 [Stellaceae bacterium]|nr:hypothetical protein [Stellaceae bacterium]
MTLQDRDAAGLLRRSGETLTALGRTVEAAEAFRQAVAADPTDEISANALAITLHGMGLTEAAAAGLDDFIKMHRPAPRTRANLAVLEAALNRHASTVHHLHDALAEDPALPGAALGLGVALRALDDIAGARSAFEQALAVPSDAFEARRALNEVCQILGDRPSALRHLKDAIAEQPVFTRPASGVAKRRLLILAVPGDWQANMPLEFLLDPADTDLSTLWLTPPATGASDPKAWLPPTLPPFDAVFTAIAECDEVAPALAAAEGIVAHLGCASFNQPALIARLSRDRVPDLLAGIPDCLVPHTARLGRDALAPSARAATLADQRLTYPFIIRPRDSHAGRDLARIDTPTDLDAWLASVVDAEVAAAPYIDYASADGLFRKLRVVFVDGQPMPYHFAIHTDWRVWYYNSGMPHHAWMREEEARFLEDMPSFVGPTVMAALEAIGRRVGLDWFGLDCAITPEGELLVFEIETGMIVHDLDDPVLYPYKKRFVPRIFRAIETMIDQRITASRAPGKFYLKGHS